MNRRLSLVIFLVFAFSAISQAQSSYIQVVAEPGISVFLDGVFKGKTSSDVGGLIIENLRAGTYTIRLTKDGFIPQEEPFTLKEGEVKPYNVKPFAPKIKVRQEGNSQDQTIITSTGNLIIQSIPIYISFEIPRLGSTFEKVADKWIGEEIPEGDYIVRYFWNGKVLSDTLRIVYNKTTHILVNMTKLKIENRSITDIHQTITSKEPDKYSTRADKLYLASKILYMAKKESDKIASTNKGKENFAEFAVKAATNQINVEARAKAQEIIEDGYIDPMEYVVLIPDDFAKFRGEYIDKFVDWIDEQIEVSEIAKGNSTHGTVLVKFVINSLGDICSIEIDKGLDMEIDLEVLRIITSSPKWDPATKGKKNKAITSLVSVPIHF